MANFWVYILKCVSRSKKRKTYYVGSTADLQKRLAQHRAGLTRSTKNKELSLVYCETLPSRREAYRREYELKRYSKKRKLELIESFSALPNISEEL